MFKLTIFIIGLFYSLVTNAGVHVVGNGAGILEAQMMITYQKLPQMLELCSQNKDCRNNVGTETIKLLTEFSKNYNLMFYTEAQYPFSNHQFILKNHQVSINVDQLYRDYPSVLHFDNEQALGVILHIARTWAQFDVDNVKTIFLSMFKSQQIIREFDSFGATGVYFVYDQLFSAKLLIHDPDQEIDLNKEIGAQLNCAEFNLSSMTNLRILMPLPNQFQLSAYIEYQCQNQAFLAKIVIQGQLRNVQNETGSQPAKRISSIHVSVWDIENK